MTDRVKGKGFFLFVVPGAKPMAREEIERLAVQAGVDVGYIPKYPGDREMFSRAVDRGHSHGNKGGWIIRQITSNANECVCGVANAGRDPAALILRPTYIDRFSWKLGDPSVVDPGGHPIGGYVKGVYDSLVGKVVGEDWTECNRRFFLDVCLGVSLHRGFFWVPESSRGVLDKYLGLIKLGGLTPLLFEVQPEQAQAAAAAAQSSLTEEIEKLKVEVAGFDGEQRTGTYERRLERFQVLRQRAELYSAALGVAADEVSGVIVDLERQVRGFLDVKEQAKATKAAQPKPPAQKQAGPIQLNGDGGATVSGTGTATPEVPVVPVPPVPVPVPVPVSVSGGPAAWAPPPPPVPSAWAPPPLPPPVVLVVPVVEPPAREIVPAQIKFHNLSLTGGQDATGTSGTWETSVGDPSRVKSLLEPTGILNGWRYFGAVQAKVEVLVEEKKVQILMKNLDKVTDKAGLTRLLKTVYIDITGITG